jgi:hypothetical protein
VEELVIDPRFNGPAGSANGGYTCGLVAGLLGGVAEVTLRSPPPLGRPLQVEQVDDRVRVFDRERLVAEAVPTELELEIPEAPSYADATQASERYPGFGEHAFPTCFVCGPQRKSGDGLRIFAGPLADGRVASPWVVPDEIDSAFVWAALDCPGAYAVEFGQRGNPVLGRLTAHVEHLPHPGERCVVMGWPLGEEGRKLYAGTVLFGEDHRLLGSARTTWIVPKS